MEKNVQLGVFDFFKKEKFKKGNNFYFNLFFTVFFISIVYMFIGMYSIETEIISSKKAVIQVLSNPYSIEKYLLSEIDENVTEKKNGQITNYYFKFKNRKYDYFFNPELQAYEIEKTNNSKTLIMRNVNFETIDQEWYNYKDLLKNVKVSEVKSLLSESPRPKETGLLL